MPMDNKQYYLLKFHGVCTQSKINSINNDIIPQTRLFLGYCILIYQGVHCCTKA